MPTYLHPGVYLEEIPSGAKTIEGVSTSVTAFVGPARRGPAGVATLLHSLDEYIATYGDVHSAKDAMGLSVTAYYQNGGKDAYVARLVSTEPPAAESSRSVSGEGTGDASVLRVSASSVGTWGDDVRIRIRKPCVTASTFALEVGHLDNERLVVDETFPGLSMNDASADFALMRVNGVSKLVKLSLGAAADPEDPANQYQEGSLTGAVLDDADDVFKTGVKDAMTMTLNVDGLGAKQIVLGAAASLSLTGKNAADGAKLANAIQNAVLALGHGQTPYKDFTVTYSSDREFVLTSGTKSPSSSVVVYGGDGADKDLARLIKVDPANQYQQGSLTGAALGDADDVFKTGVKDAMTMTLNLDGLGAKQIVLGAAASLSLTGKNAADGAKLANAIQNAVLALGHGQTPYKDFIVTYSSDREFVLTSGAKSPSSSVVVYGGDGADKDLARLIKVDPAGNPTAIVGAGRIALGAGKVTPLALSGTDDLGEPLSGGVEGAPEPSDYRAFFGQKLIKIRDASIIVLPGNYMPKSGSGNDAIAAAISHAEATQRSMVIVDLEPGAQLENTDNVDQLALTTSTYAVLYYPWVEVTSPFVKPGDGSKPTILVAPSAFAAGMWAKIDGHRGVWKTPAGVETSLLGVASLEFDVGDSDQDQLNPLGVNALRKLPGFGHVIWGSRTLSTKANPEWRYIPVRRTAIFIELSVYSSIQWAVFEPNDHRLWASLRSNIDAFMNGLWRSGAFQGEKASDAYFVRCDLGDTMTQGDIDRGQVIVIVGFAPLKPAEFVIVRIQQIVGQQ